MRSARIEAAGESGARVPNPAQQGFSDFAKPTVVSATKLGFLKRRSCIVGGVYFPKIGSRALRGKGKIDEHGEWCEDDKSV